LGKRGGRGEKQRGQKKIPSTFTLGSKFHLQKETPSYQSKEEDLRVRQRIARHKSSLRERKGKNAETTCVPGWKKGGGVSVGSLYNMQERGEKGAGSPCPRLPEKETSVKFKEKNSENRTWKRDQGTPPPTL